MTTRIKNSPTEVPDEIVVQMVADIESGEMDFSHGRRITPQDLERRVGRPKLGGGAGKSPRLAFRTTDELYCRVAARARREGKTVSDIAREALDHYVP